MFIMIIVLKVISSSREMDAAEPGVRRHETDWPDFFILFKNQYFCSLHMDDVYYKELDVFMGMLAIKG